jgi:hypothetical protein
LDSWNQDQDGWTVTIVFDRADQTVFEVMVADYQRERAYRIINPDYVAAYRAEADQRGVDPDQAWDDVQYIDLETKEDWLEKAEAIVQGRDYDSRVSIPLELTDDALNALMLQAHELDITLNQHIENIVRSEIARLKQSHDFAELVASLEDDRELDFPLTKTKKNKTKKGKR